MAAKGNCFMCGKLAGKIAIKNHILKEHNEGKEDCYLIKAECGYKRDFWLFFTVPLNSTLEDIDDFLRNIWCECCYHLSVFSRDRRDIDEEKKISYFTKGDKLLYEYDFGSTTKIFITFLDMISRPKHHQPVVLLARNEPKVETCACGAPAEYINAWKGGYFCEDCIESWDEGGFLPLVNSPRCGVCGYCGENDRWIFEAGKEFPQNM